MRAFHQDGTSGDNMIRNSERSKLDSPNNKHLNGMETHFRLLDEDVSFDETNGSSDFMASRSKPKIDDSAIETDVSLLNCDAN